jgi:hypothetical protein
MRRRHDQHHVVLHEGLNMNVLPPLWPFNERKLNAPVDERLQHRIRIAAPDQKMHLGVTQAKISNEGRQQILRDRLRRPHRQFSSVIAIDSCDGGDCLLADGLHLLRIRQQRRSTGGKRDPAAASVKEWHTHLFFKRLDL